MSGCQNSRQQGSLPEEMGCETEGVACMGSIPLDPSLVQGLQNRKQEAQQLSQKPLPAMVGRAALTDMRLIILHLLMNILQF